LIFVSAAVATFAPWPFFLPAAVAVSAVPLLGGEWVKGPRQVAPRVVVAGETVFEGRGYLLGVVASIYWGMGCIMMLVLPQSPGNWWGGFFAALLLSPGVALVGALRRSWIVCTADRIAYYVRGRQEWVIAWSEVTSIERVRRVLIVGKGSRIPYWCIDITRTTGETSTLSGLRLPASVIQNLSGFFQAEATRRPAIRWGPAAEGTRRPSPQP
jgi:hypothetical protein